MLYDCEKFEAICKDPPKIDPRYYRLYADVVDRMGVDWLERVVMDYDDDHPKRDKR